jgi:hypothetical protein
MCVTCIKSKGGSVQARRGDDRARRGASWDVLSGQPWHTADVSLGSLISRGRPLWT